MSSPSLPEHRAATRRIPWGDVTSVTTTMVASRLACPNPTCVQPPGRPSRGGSGGRLELVPDGLQAPRRRPEALEALELVGDALRAPVHREQIQRGGDHVRV